MSEHAPNFSSGVLVGITIGLLVGVLVMMSGPLTPFIVNQLANLGIEMPRIQGKQVREYTLFVRQTTLSLGDGTWDAWTYNGTVPGPTLYARVGETIRVRVVNQLDLVHSFHTHLAPYDLQYDGSQANVIANVGAGAMIPPGNEYVFELPANAAGIYYYHCHSADGQLRIVDHILQGLYGAIVVDDPEAPQYQDFVIFMAEIGHRTTGKVPTYILNGKGIPGGEHALEGIFKEKGIAGVAEQFNKTVLTYKASIGQPIRIHIINIGDLIHSFHLHGMSLVSQQYFPGRVWPANVVQLLPGAAETIIVTPQYAGIWLFHCHVVSHADAGMIGLLIVE